MSDAADPVRAIADAVLYEGYILWPYRRSAIKNAQRWTFGGVYPRDHSQGRVDDPWQMQTQILVLGEPDVEISVRFLHVVRRQVLLDGAPVDRATVAGEQHLSWNEARERELAPGRVEIAEGGEREELGGGVSIVRSWRGLTGSVNVASDELRSGLHRLTVRISNTTPFSGADREQALEQTFCSCHTVLRAGERSELVSATDPPAELQAEAAACSNEGTWPVLLGEPGEHAIMLSSPIILEDHPRIAPESPGDLFDGGEIDQMLILNILSLTDAEKAEMRASDPRAREILERTERLTGDQLMALNGTIRELRYVR
ncbi:MAG: hypothetical protein NVSMB25_08340 [Thermoleophilaceae bacterium]